MQKAAAKAPAFVTPLPSKEATNHNGGKIYWSRGLFAFRVFARRGDKKEKRIRFNKFKGKELRDSWAECLEHIDDDTRPRHIV